MSNHREMANQLMTALEVSLPPIAMAFCDNIPAGVPQYDGTVPAGCVFWQEASTRTFATSAKDHELCSIGVHTHHFSEAPEAQQGELQEALKAMIGLDYVREEEIAAIPVLQRDVKHVVYGPLSEFPVAPDIVLLFAHAEQGLVLAEAAARVDGGAPPAMGRPACAIVSHVLNGGRAAESLGCCGARAYLDALTNNVALWAFPATKLDQYCDQIGVLARANKTLTKFHERRRADVESGERPSVRLSLQRLSS